MANLFPDGEIAGEQTESASEKVVFGRSWRFDYESGEFAMTPTGKIASCEDTEAWLEWCKKALQTERYRYLAYSRDYGQEFQDLIGLSLSRSAVESEIRRIASETLLTDERTAGVSDFSFEWDNDACYFSCRVSNDLEESGIIEGSVVNR